ncbi:hypothetical protein OH686_23365 [Pseudomonas sp. SO81]|nr:hypothetical protein OH686_23365 [Pseudomonas sp. SO81]
MKSPWPTSAAPGSSLRQSAQANGAAISNHSRAVRRSVGEVEMAKTMAIL